MAAMRMTRGFRVGRWPVRARAAVVVALLTAAVSVGHASPLGAAVQPVGDAQATVETTPVLSTGDAADDPAIWVHPTDPARSVVIGNDKGGALEVYDLSGARIQRIAEGFFGNVDVRKGFVTGTGSSDLVVVARQGIRVYRIDPSTRLLTNITDTTSGSIDTSFGGEGLCLYRSPSGSMYAFVNARSGRIAQFALTDSDGDGRVEGTRLRDWDVGTEVEGCVADDELGSLYVSEEDVGIWKYGAEPTDATTPASRVRVDGTTATGGHLVPDVEGLAIVYQAGGTGYLIASSQAASNTLNNYAVYERQGANAFVRTFKVVNGASVDGCGRTDGIAAFAGNLGPSFPQGLFVCQDNNNTEPGTSSIRNQNFKFVPLERVVGLGTDSPPPNQPPEAVSAADCTDMTCDVSSVGSRDPDGTVVAYAWDLGDGTTGTGPSLSHTYSMAGSYTITLTITDDDGATDQASGSVTVPSPTQEVISFVGQAMSNVNATSHAVTVPAAVVPGDGLLLFVASSTTATVSDPTGVTGWQPVGTLTGPSAVTRVWKKVAGPGDPGGSVRVGVSAISKANMVVVGYRGTSRVDPVAASARGADVAGTSSHTTPTASVTTGRSWGVSYWTHKDSATTALTPPTGVTVRASGTQTGGGRVTGLVADSGAVVPIGSYGGLRATASATTSNATMWTIILAPAS